MARRSSSKSWLDVSQSGGKSDSLETVSAATAAGGGGGDGMVLGVVVEEALARYRNIRPARTATNAGKRFSIFKKQFKLLKGTVSRCLIPGAYLIIPYSKHGYTLSIDYQ